MLLAAVAAAPLPGPDLPSQLPAQPQIQAERFSQLLAEAAHAIAAGRNDQARAMIAAAIAAGASGEPVDRLLADLAFVTGDDAQALAGYAQLVERNADDALLAERAGIAALRLGETARAVALLDRATALPAAGWRAWNARAVAADRLGEWDAADLCYARAAALAPASGEVANNRGWSLLLRGRWAEAHGELVRAAALAPANRRIAANLELAGFALVDGLPPRRAGEFDSEWAARLNDAGVVAQLTGDRRRAIAAFAQAIDARSDWFARAANNLAAAEAGR